MWPFSDSGSRVYGAPNKPKIHVDLSSFATSDKDLDVTLTQDIWSMIEWLSVVSDSTHIDVIRALLFRGLYGHVAYEQLLEHAKEQHQRDMSLLDEEDFAFPIPPNSDSGQAEIDHSLDIRKSRARSSTADVKYVGKSNLQRKLRVPNRMWFDLDRQASKAGAELSRYVRGLLFRELQGEVNYNQWQYARAELDDCVKPPSRK